ncbi:MULTISPECIES: glutamine amidotransferase [unclassified Frigoribacterium]|uniref:glutamine amidotransferase n=1 Tax=unclassified Frigoribacterium TaxID=2627005 RepID=UPI0006F7959A|nr:MULTISPECIES: glutamine amidotransferase [unclassified Frigoribacterium]KQM29152.1 cytoplasmic protein [Frigoribacterium sp. Leaf8]MBD8484545.1 cytoplasmic protein [Frigoribacterium sp. CFBP 8759]WAC52635.1 glutamine amidotransferase [Frigoribacterium sp. SL97]
MSRILIAGESWITATTHTKGVDEFTAHSYTEGVAQLRTALQAGGHEVVHLPAHLVATGFPETQEALDAYDVVVLSDIGVNSLQLAPAVFEKSIPGRDRVRELARWVEAGGALLMIGGYLSFSGWQGRAGYARTEIADVLPVEMLIGDDRVERPAGVVATVLDAEHPALGGAGTEWPLLLGYNRTVVKPGAVELARLDGDPLVVVGEAGAGRTAVFTSDCSPHWAPPAFCEEWDGYARVFNGIVSWLTGR